MPRTTADTRDAVGRLCPKCGLCCSGVLFADLVLQPGDRPALLKKLDVPLQKRGSRIRVLQPCPCLEKNLCRIYRDRPIYCRAFECQLLRRVKAGELTDEAALTTIRQARRQIEAVRRLVCRLGQTDETHPLSRRYREAMRQPIDLSQGEGDSELHGQLIRAYAKLAKNLDDSFR